MPEGDRWPASRQIARDLLDSPLLELKERRPRPSALPTPSPRQPEPAPEAGPGYKTVLAVLLG